MAPLSPGIVPGAQFDDGAGLRVASHVDIVEPEMVGATIDAIDNGIGAAFEFIIKPAINQTAHDRIARGRLVDREAGHVDRKSKRLTSSHKCATRMPSSAEKK